MMNSTKLQDFIILNRLGDDIKVDIRYSKKASRISIKINAGKVELVIPYRREYSGYDFLLSKESWIRKKLKHINEGSSIEENIIPVFDQQHHIHNVDLSHNIVQVKNNNIYVYASESDQKSILIEYLYKLLLNEIYQIIIPISEQYKISFSDIKIMNNKTRWGSCSTSGVLKFNWRLVFADKSVLKYLIVHELSHRLEMNHSKKFWDVVERIYPEYKVPKTWLKKNGFKIHSYLS